MQWISLAVLGKRIKAIKYMMRDKTVPKGKKLLVILGLVYLVLPVDLIPPIIPVFGFLDDIILWLFILSSLKDVLDRYWQTEGMENDRRDPKARYPGKHLIDDVTFEVKEEDCDQDKE